MGILLTAMFLDKAAKQNNMITEEKESHAFEAGRRAKPDEFESQLVNLIGARIIEIGKDIHFQPRFDLRMNGGYDRNDERYIVNVGGEVSRKILQQDILPEIDRIIIDHYNKVNKTNLGDEQFKICYDGWNSQNSSLATNIKAGDRGNPIAVAVSNSPNLLPWERYLTVKIRDIIDATFQREVPKFYAGLSGIESIPGLRSDGKVDVKSFYYEGVLDSIDTITIAAQHGPDLLLPDLRNHLTEIILPFLKYEEEKRDIDLGTPEILVNTGPLFHDGGWKTDAGNREAKPYRDGFSTHGCNEDSFSGEDPTKVSATGTMMARHIAVQVINNGLADYAKVSLDYSIGQNEVRLNVFTAGTGKIKQNKLHQWVKDHYSMSIPEAIELFDLWNPEQYRKIAENSDYFHDPSFPWNQEDQEVNFPNSRFK